MRPSGSLLRRRGLVRWNGCYRQLLVLQHFGGIVERAGLTRGDAACAAGIIRL